VAPLQFADGEGAESLGLTGEEQIDVSDLRNGEAKSVTVTARREGGGETTFECTVRLDTPNEVRYFQHGGILQRVLRQLRDHGT
jgi:aconitate hydratase